MKVVGKAEGEIDSKRFYIPGLFLEGKCPECGEPYEKDYTSEYLMYPQAGEPFEEYCHCMECNHEWPVKMQLDIKLKLIKE